MKIDNLKDKFIYSWFELKFVINIFFIDILTNIMHIILRFKYNYIS